MSKYAWGVTEDAYRKRIRYVHCSTGKIVGNVSGVNNALYSEWDALVRLEKETHIGSYVTESQAKKAVEERVAMLEEKKTRKFSCIMSLK